MASIVNKTKKRINFLIKMLNHYNEQYHTYDISKITDEEYDNFYTELKELEAAFPSLSSTDSPTKRVGSKLLDGFKKVKHSSPMLSLSNALNYDDFESFYNRLNINYPKEDITLFAEPKFDGLAMSIEYVNGHFLSATTRGDGYVGEDVTSNVRTIKGLPLSLKGSNIPEKLSLKAEVFMNIKDFENINKNLISNNEKAFANPRNVAAGAIRQLDPKVAAKRKLQIFFHGILYIDNISKYKSHSQLLNHIKKMGLNICDHNMIIKDLSDAQEYFEKMENMRNKLPYEIDGIVYKIDNLNLQNKIGATSKAPKWSIAYKFKSEGGISKLLGVTFQIGRTGVITPVAELDPIKVGGVTVSRATLHNMDEIQKKDIMIGDFVYVKRAGDVIPKIEKVIIKKRKSVTKINIPIDCPSCGAKIVKISDQSIYKCPNQYNCLPQIKQVIIHFVSRKAMNIPGLGDSIISMLVDKELITNYSDLYYLQMSDLTELDGMAEKSSSNILASIDKSKSIMFDRFIYALGIKEVGDTTSKVLAMHYKNIRQLLYTKLDELESIKDIGPIVAKNIIDFVAEKRNMKIIDRLITGGLLIKYNNSQSNILEGKTYVITGSFSKYKRDHIREILVNKGAKVSSSISRNTTALILGDKPGSKFKKAQDLDIDIISEDSLSKLL